MEALPMKYYGTSAGFAYSIILKNHKHLLAFYNGKLIIIAVRTKGVGYYGQPNYDSILRRNRLTLSKQMKWYGSD